MSIDIDLYAYDYKELVSKIVKQLKLDGAEEELQKIEVILERFGYITKDKQEYIILNNEYYEDGNPYFNICYVICSAFGKSESNEDLFGQVFLNFRGNGLERENLINYVDKYDVADELNIDLVLDEEDE